MSLVLPLALAGANPLTASNPSVQEEPQETVNAVVSSTLPTLLTKAESLNGTYGGECVYFVQKFMGRLDNCQNVDCNKAVFRGDASKIQPNSQEPRIGSVVLLQYNLGHVAVVVDIQGGDLVLAESNFHLDGKIEVGRRVSTTDSHIRGYYDFKAEDVEHWIEELVKLESNGREDIVIVDVNGKKSYSCLQFQEETFERYSKRYGIEGDIMSCDFQKRLARLMIQENPKNVSHWHTSVFKRGLGPPSL